MTSSSLPRVFFLLLLALLCTFAQEPEGKTLIAGIENSQALPFSGYISFNFQTSRLVTFSFSTAASCQITILQDGVEQVTKYQLNSGTYTKFFLSSSNNRVYVIRIYNDKQQAGFVNVKAQTSVDPSPYPELAPGIIVVIAMAGICGLVLIALKICIIVFCCCCIFSCCGCINNNSSNRYPTPVATQPSGYQTIVHHPPAQQPNYITTVNYYQAPVPENQYIISMQPQVYGGSSVASAPPAHFAN